MKPRFGIVPRVVVGLLPLAMLGLVLITGPGCGKQEEEKEYESQLDEWKASHFSVEPQASRYYGPAPFTVKLWTTTLNATGTVKYEWAFGDGTTSTEATPTHTFAKPGLYSIGVAGTDPNGERDGGSVIVRSETPEEAEKNKDAERDAAEAEEERNKDAAKTGDLGEN